MSRQLPSKQGDFASRAYWDDFFAQEMKKNESVSGKKKASALDEHNSNNKSAFEWYAEWDDLKPLVSSSLRGGRLLELGCGSSDLSFALAQTDKFDKVTAVDFSSVVIQSMKEKQQKLYPAASFSRTVEFLEADFFALPTEWTSTFAVVVDKGALDALLSDSTKEEGGQRGKDYMNQVARVTSDVFWCVSLLESNVLDALLDSALGFGAWRSATITSFHPKQASKLCPFLIVMKKQAGIDSTTFEGVHVDGEDCRANRERIVRAVERSRQTYEAKRALETEKKQGIRGSFWIGHNQRFELTVVDASPKVVAIPFGAMILPLGREHEWGYRSEEGLTDLARTNGISRLIVIALGRDQDWSKSTQESLQKEVSPAVLELAPKGLLEKGYNVPFLGASSGDDELGSRETLYKVDSETSGEILVERVCMPGDDKTVFRRMLFTSTPWAVQSECRVLATAEGEKVDALHLCFPLHQAMAVARSIVDLISSDDVNESSSKALVVGLGGGGLAAYLAASKTFEVIQGIDLDAHVLTIANEWFGLKELSKDHKIETILGDGLEFLAAKARAEARDVRAVFIDVDSKKETAAGLLFPPFEFISFDFLVSMRDKVLTPKLGAMVVNLGSRSEQDRKGFFKIFKQVFERVALLSMAPFQDINVIVVAWGRRGDSSEGVTSLPTEFRRVQEEILEKQFDGELSESLMWMDDEFNVYDARGVDAKWPATTTTTTASTSKKKKKSKNKKR